LGGEEGPSSTEVSGAVDLTRTVGWFTSLYPVRLDPGLLDLEEALSGGPALGRVLKTIKEQLRAVPGKGRGYGLLRYLNGETAAELAGAPAPQLGFNYLGRFAAGAEGADWAPASLDENADQDDAARRGGGDPALPLAHLIEINALTLDEASGELDLGRCTARRGCGPRSGRDLVPGADGARPPCGTAPCRRTDAERSGAGRSDPRRDRTVGGRVPND
jgi:non-ribosomal peptide synthase protein (TIGR01720 family)